METNYAGFKDKVNPTTRQYYDSLTRAYTTLAKANKNPVYCLVMLKEWLRFFNDGHVQVQAVQAASGTDTTGLAERMQHTEMISLSPEKLQQLRNNDNGEEGIYRSLNDSTYTIAIVKDSNEFRDFAGVILSARNDLWRPGQVKLEIQKPRLNPYYSTIAYNLYHVPGLREFTFSGTSFDGGAWTKVARTEVTPPPGKNLFVYKKVAARKLTDSTLYLQVGTFNLTNAKAIDSVIRANEPLLKTMPYLVIDLRHNSGGGDNAYHPLLPWLYTGPVYSSGIQLYATPDNIKRDQANADDPALPEAVRNDIRSDIRLMQQHVGELVAAGGDDTLKPEKIEPNPRRIVLLTDENCASSTEEFIFAARQSTKVTIMGRHTYGALEPSNWLVAPSPCPDITFHYSSTRSSRIDKGQGIDGTGIKPGIELPENIDWIEAARKYLEQQQYPELNPRH